MAAAAQTVLCQGRSLIHFNPSSSSSPSFTQLNLIKKTPFQRFKMTTNTNTYTSAAALSTSSSSLNTTAAIVDEPPNHTDALPSSSKWPAFAANVSGEWDGHGADFDLQGKPLELPEQVVPEAYREWEVKVFDWQTQCPTLAQTTHLSAIYKLIKLLPTVGCEADAATRHTVEERKIGGSDNTVSAFAYQSNGSYVAVWKLKDRLSKQMLELESCFVDPQDREARVRIIQVVGVDNTKLVLKCIRVFVEQWYGPFRNGEQLGGCSIRDSAFASTEALNSSEVIGAWEGSRAVANFQDSDDGILQELVDDSVLKLVRDEQSLVLLPKKLWSSVKEKDGETCFEVGWLSKQGQALTSKCIFSSSADLKEIATAQETAVVGH